MSTSNKQIVCISQQYWDEPWFRKQHFMWRFVQRGYRVAYIEPSFSIVRKPEEGKKGHATNRLFTISVERREENLFIIKPPRCIPFWTHPFISRINHYYFAYKIKKALDCLDFKDFILWTYVPQYVVGLKLFKPRKLVVDITDDLAAFSKHSASKSRYLRQCIERLLQESDLKIVTAKTLYDKFCAKTNVYLIPNGYDPNLFRANPSLVPNDLKDIRHPIVGFVGTIFSFLDFELIKYIVRTNQDKSFVFVGPCESYVRNKWMELLREKNLFWLGRKRKEEIPLYINSFDVCINPFKVDEVSRSAQPLKIYEYLACRKNVVSVRMESLENEAVSRLICFADDYDDFNGKLNLTLAERLDNRTFEILENYSWENLFKKLLLIVEDNLFTDEM